MESQVYTMDKNAGKGTRWSCTGLKWMPSLYRMVLDGILSHVSHSASLCHTVRCKQCIFPPRWKKENTVGSTHTPHTNTCGSVSAAAASRAPNLHPKRQTAHFCPLSSLLPGGTRRKNPARRCSAPVSRGMATAKPAHLPSPAQTCPCKSL